MKYSLFFSLIFLFNTTPNTEPPALKSAMLNHTGTFLHCKGLNLSACSYLNKTKRTHKHTHHTFVCIYLLLHISALKATGRHKAICNYLELKCCSYTHDTQRRLYVYETHLWPSDAPHPHLMKQGVINLTIALESHFCNWLSQSLTDITNGLSEITAISVDLVFLLFFLKNNFACNFLTVPGC